MALFLAEVFFMTLDPAEVFFMALFPAEVFFIALGPAEARQIAAAQQCEKKKRAQKEAGSKTIKASI